tara:strand:- start:32553 stop:32714 length:162 start_codon:yes stop_codon:yes gene_type:complete
MQGLETTNVNNLKRVDNLPAKPTELGGEDPGCGNKEKFDDMLEKLKGVTNTEK